MWQFTRLFVQNLSSLCPTYTLFWDYFCEVFLNFIRLHLHFLIYFYSICLTLLIFSLHLSFFCSSFLPSMCSFFYQSPSFLPPFQGTNPASASMCGMKVVVVNSDENGNIDLEDLKAKALKHKDTLVSLQLLCFYRSHSLLCNLPPFDHMYPLPISSFPTSSFVYFLMY